MLSNTDPWHYLGVDGTALDEIMSATTTSQVVSSLYILFKTVGIIGCAITMVFALIKLASSNGNGRAEAKQMFTKKVVILMAIFLSAYVFGTVWGIIANM